MEAVLHEFGSKHVSGALSHQFLVERAEVFIKERAVFKLRAYVYLQQIPKEE